MNSVDYKNEAQISTARFVGRQTLINKVYSRIGAGRPQSVSLVGDYKIGKTALLNYLADISTQNRYLDDPKDYYCLQLAVKEETDSLDKFVELLCKSIAETVQSDFSFNSTTESYDWFKRIIETMSKRNKKFILFMDDFNLITQNEAFPLEFFSFLRSLANNYNVAYVTTSYLDLQQLCVSKDVEESPFFNIFTNITIKAFDEAEVEMFLQMASAEDNIDFKTYRELIFRYAGYFPYLLQIACAQIKECVENKIMATDLQEIFAEKFKKYTDDYFRKIWKDMPEDSKNVLKLVARNKKIDTTSQYLLQELSQKQLISTNNSKPQIFSPAFLDFICKNTNSSKTGSGLVAILVKIFGLRKG